MTDSSAKGVLYMTFLNLGSRKKHVYRIRRVHWMIENSLCPAEPRIGALSCSNIHCSLLPNMPDELQQPFQNFLIECGVRSQFLPAGKNSVDQSLTKGDKTNFGAKGQIVRISSKGMCAGMIHNARCGPPNVFQRIVFWEYSSKFFASKLSKLFPCGFWPYRFPYLSRKCFVN